ncbi:hypothetical protein AbraIFM66951_000557 [Aspergillus brasiliensis]|uniref:Uncharacterized protein n=1 Tax=Aspergillus brasiliensis TaxID=319629 RepID=A0A9W5YWR1_9EURO|nr:hypothetical protein AbraCBS73388_000671 [Aspergillus brasiliensis]GKZ48489.1 hypothetical protein AbraIFM66951_000557 [Aspergillus brasiliensis]
MYTGLTTYLIKICSTTEVLELAGSRRKNFDIPSWVPDWSQALSTSGTAISSGDEDLDWKDDEVTGLGHVVFNNCLPFDWA